MRFLRACAVDGTKDARFLRAQSGRRPTRTAGADDRTRVGDAEHSIADVESLHAVRDGLDPADAKGWARFS